MSEFTMKLKSNFHIGPVNIFIILDTGNSGIIFWWFVDKNTAYKGLNMVCLKFMMLLYLFDPESWNDYS